MPGIQTRTIQSGTGPVLLCLHGIGGSAESFRPQLEGLGGHFRVIARDAPGYGGSPAFPDYPGAAGYVQEVIDVIDGSGEDRVILLGMSWGGVIAMETALAHPHRVAALVLGDSTRGSGRSPVQAVAMRERAEELRRVGPERYARSRTARLLAPGTGEELIERHAAASARSLRIEGFAHATRFMADADLSSRLGAIAVPTLVIYGEQDVVTGAAESVPLRDGIPGAELVSIPHAGHLANQEAANAFNRELLRYARSLGLLSSSS